MMKICRTMRWKIRKQPEREGRENEEQQAVLPASACSRNFQKETPGEKDKNLEMKKWLMEAIRQRTSDSIWKKVF